MKLLLASQSAARRRMLEAAGVPFEAVAAQVDEEALKAGLQGLGAIDLAAALAEAKALSVGAGHGDLVLGSDQSLETDSGAMLSKAGSPDELADQLRSLSGRTHRLHAAAVVAEGRLPVWSHLETVEMVMRPLSDGFIARYVASEYEAVRWSVGGYHIEGRGAQLFERVDGSHFAVLGMPLLPLLGLLRERGLLCS